MGNYVLDILYETWYLFNNPSWTRIPKDKHKRDTNMDKLQYCMSKKSWPILYSKYTMDQDFVDRQ